MSLMNSEYVRKIMLYLIKKDWKNFLFQEIYFKYVFHSPKWGRKIWEKCKGKRKEKHLSFQGGNDLNDSHSVGK